MVKAAKLSFMKPQKRKDGVFKMTQYPGLTQRQAQQNRVDYGDNLLEILVFHSATSGAANDIENATKIARAMVTMYGMSDTFGMMCLATVENQYLDGRAGLICGEDTAGQIDKEVLSIINKSYEDAMQMLTENRDILDHISDYLYEKETITGKEFMKIFREMKGLPQEEDKESLMPDDTADEKKASQEPRVLSKENNEAKDGTSIAEDSQSKAAIVSDDMFEE